MYTVIDSISWPLDSHGKLHYPRMAGRSFPILYCRNEAHYPSLSRPLYELFDCKRRTFFKPEHRVKPGTRGVEVPIHDDDEDLSQFLRSVDESRRKGAYDAVLVKETLKELRSSYSINESTRFFGFPRIAPVRLKVKTPLSHLDIVCSPVDNGLLVRPEVAERYPQIQSIPATVEISADKRFEDWREWVILEGGTIGVGEGLFLEPCPHCGECVKSVKLKGAPRLIIDRFNDARLFRCFGISALFFEQEFYNELTLSYRTNLEENRSAWLTLAICMGG